MTDTPRDPATDQEIARRAYARWESEGRPHGRDREHWSQAEAELLDGPEELPAHQERLLPGEAARLPGYSPEPGAGAPDGARPAARRRSVRAAP